MNRSQLIVFFTLCVTKVCAQYSEKELTEFINKSSEKELVIESSLLMEQGFYYSAEKISDKLLTIQPESSNYNYRKGYLLLLSNADAGAATPYLEKAVNDIDKNFDRNSANEKSAPIDAIYHLACCYHASERIDEAIKLYNKYISESDKKALLVPIAKLKIGQCELAAKMIQKPDLDVSVKNAGAVINSAYPDYSAIISLDGSSLFFTSRRPWEDGSSDIYKDRRNNLHPEDVYVSYLDPDDNWTIPARLNFCKSESNEATVAVSSDERRVYVYKDETGEGDIYYTDFSENKFREVAFLEDHDINTKFWEPHVTVSPDGSVMYLVSERPGGIGGRDIYEVLKDENGKWGAPKNMGPKVNTPFDEDSPFISVDGKNLYFSSNGPGSMGGFDILMSVKADDKWSASVNLGYPINSCGDDLYYTTTIDGYKGYFTSFRKDGSGEKDIYQVTNNYLGIKDLSFLKEKIYTYENKKLPEDVGITFKCMDCEQPHQGTVYPRLRDGLIITSLEPCKTYEITYHHEQGQKEISKETIKTECNKHYSELYREVLLNIDEMTITPVEAPEKDSVIQLETVPVADYKKLEAKYWFRYDDNKLSMKGKDFRKFLKEVEQQLKTSEGSITVQVFSSASRVPTRKYENNQVLANLRAENVKYDIVTYFQQNSKLQSRVNVVVVETGVNGPEYQNDSKNIEKYKPYQFVLLKTE